MGCLLSILAAFWISGLGSSPRTTNAHMRRWTTSNWPTRSKGMSWSESSKSNFAFEGQNSGLGKWVLAISNAVTCDEESWLATSIAQILNRYILELGCDQCGPVVYAYPVPAPMSAIAMPFLIGTSGWRRCFECSCHSRCWDPSLLDVLIPRLIWFKLLYGTQYCKAYLMASTRSRLK